jgi:intraflagellar transport protein 122
MTQLQGGLWLSHKEVCQSAVRRLNVSGSLLQGTYAHRVSMTDILIESLSGGNRTRIKCNSYVQRIAVYDSLVAVQLNGSFVVYKRVAREGGSVQYNVKAHIDLDQGCDLLLVSSKHLTICYQNKLRCYNFDSVQYVPQPVHDWSSDPKLMRTLEGKTNAWGSRDRGYFQLYPCATSCREKEWVLEDNVHFVKCLGGPPGREGVLVACRDGSVMTIYLDNSFPCQLWKHQRPIRYADLSSKSSFLAFIDDGGSMSVISLKNGTACPLSLMNACTSA